MMHPRHFTRRAAGFSLVTAIFLLVVLAGLGAAIVNIAASSRSSITLDVQGARAYQAARAGIEWGLYRYLRQNAPCDRTDSFPLPSPSSGSTLSGFTVTVVCSTSVQAGATVATVQRSTQLTAGSTMATLVGATTGLNAGMVVSSNGAAGIVLGTMVTAVDPNTNTVTLSNAANVSGTLNIAYISPLDRRQLRATACNQPAAATASCPNQNNSPDYVQRVVQVQF